MAKAEARQNARTDCRSRTLPSARVSAVASIETRVLVERRDEASRLVEAGHLLRLSRRDKSRARGSFRESEGEGGGGAGLAAKLR